MGEKNRISIGIPDAMVARIIDMVQDGTTNAINELNQMVEPVVIVEERAPKSVTPDILFMVGKNPVTC